MRVTIDQAREQGLAPSVVDLGLRVRLEDRVGGPDRRDRVAFDRERHIVLNGIGVHDRRMREDDGSAWTRLSLQSAVLQQDGCGASAGSGEQLAPGEGRANPSIVA